MRFIDSYGLNILKLMTCTKYGSRTSHIQIIDSYGLNRLRLMTCTIKIYFYNKNINFRFSFGFIQN